MLHSFGTVSRRLASVSMRDRNPLAEPRQPASLRRLAEHKRTACEAGLERAAPRQFAPGAREARTARVEAVLLLASEPLSSRRIGQFARLADGPEARTLIRRLNRLYDVQGSAFRVVEVVGRFLLLSR